MRIATWNVNGLRSRLDYALLWLRERQPDLVGLQELKLTEEQFPFEEFAAEGYQAVVHGQKAWNGVATLSKSPMEPTQLGLPGQDEAGARLLAIQQGPLHFITVYCPNGKSVDHPDFALKLAWFDALQNYLTTTYTPTDAVILCGDFNICPTPMDTFNEREGRCHHTVAERQRFEAFQTWGLLDLFRQRHPDTEAYSWWDYRAGAFHRNQGLRIDFLMGTRSLLPAIDDVQIDRDFRKKKDGLISSDHAPVWVDLSELPGAE